MVGSEEEADDTMKMDEDSVPLELILLVLLMIVSVFMVDNIGGTCGCGKKKENQDGKISLSQFPEIQGRTKYAKTTDEGATTVPPQASATPIASTPAK